MSRALITCPILTYNNFEHIYEAIDSILAQDYPDIEIAIFDDGSERFPYSELSQYIECNKKENIKNVIISQSEINEGTVKNENKMISMTHGKYIAEIGQDDRFHNSSSVGIIVDFFEKNEADIVSAYRQSFYEDSSKKQIVPRRINAKRFKNADPKEQYKMIATGIAIAGAGTFYSRRIYEKIGLFDESYVLQEDGPFFLLATRNGIKIHFLDQLVYDYRIGKGVSSSPEFNQKLLKDINRMFEVEIDPYIELFTRYERRMIEYERTRITYQKHLTKSDKIMLFKKYGDVMLYRKLFAH